MNDNQTEHEPIKTTQPELLTHQSVPSEQDKPTAIEQTKSDNSINQELGAVSNNQTNESSSSSKTTINTTYDYPQSNDEHTKDDQTQQSSKNDSDLSQVNINQPPSPRMNIPPNQPVQNPAEQETLDLSNQPDGVKELANMFPQIQPSILAAVLSAHGNDPGACVSDLLAMSDPSWKPSQEEVVQQTDEQLARQLAYQERQLASQPPPLPSRINVPYQPRIKRTGSSGNTQNSQTNWQSNPDHQVQPESGGKDELQKITEELSKLAETGKKTVSSWLTKAKAKMQEIQNNNSSSSLDQSHSERLDAYEHVQVPSLNDLPNKSPNNPSPANRSTRISPLPFASRYENNTKADKSFPPTNNPIRSPVTEGYKVDEPGPSTKGPVGMSEKTIGVGTSATHKVRQDDEESLEYTRNPFEDDD